jgi:glycosyltransferase involved in cell wall biosynthesis
MGAQLRIIFVTDTLAETMGYAGTRIPAAMAKIPGMDVHLVTAGLPAYYQIADYDKTYSTFQKPKIDVGAIKCFDGFQIHYIGHRATYGGIKLLGLRDKLAQLKPDIVQVFTHTGWAAIDLARFQRRFDYKLFTGNHSGKIVYAPARMQLKPWSYIRIREFLRRGLPGRFIASRSVLCYGATEDCSEVAVRFLGVPASKIKTASLGVETDVFHPTSSEAERISADDVRSKLGVLQGEIMCVYTGKMTLEKNASLLAKAIAELRKEGQLFRAVFYGAGPQSEEIANIKDAIVHPFVNYKQLGNVYRAANIAVWPAEITTSTLDAAACGIPVVVHDQILAQERYEGNGLTFKSNDLDDLKRVLLQLKDQDLRKKLGDEGARKMRDEFSWDALVKVRLDDYRAALGRNE